MTITTAVRKDHELQTSVQDELEWDPSLNAARIGVAVDDGAVLLSGQVGNYLEKVQANRAALRVRGVGTVVNDLVVHNPSTAPTEIDLAKSITEALRWSANVPDSVKAEVHGNTVTLLGDVQWNFERNGARRAIEWVHGVDHIDNRITLRARPTADDAAARIRAALVRNAALDADKIQVQIEGNHATLTGSVQSWAERHEAEAAAWSSPHITQLKNEILVKPLRG
ncbi:BON domain-containing protein [Cryobacterium sp. PAMC25264]|uniref:BON domain-containing protein n=1 Tax=Cryobacterium sp. PAMC25264 TaxID=2861288 RepID=UPI001C62CB0E|nr:BON domain-containing protein [Cryobacterium sp. PAMC25264]QYF73151.1 BON domain-containing protein [Cryobacterium sp. PAMC25264]